MMTQMNALPMKVWTLGELFKQDIEKAYFLLVFPSSYSTNSKLLNKDKYCFYDFPPLPATYRELVYPQALSCTAGNEFPVLVDHQPPDYLKQHWKTWLPVFPTPNFISIDKGIKDDEIPVVTTGAFENIPRSKHIIDPDILQWLQLKSSIPEIGVPHPRYMEENNVEFPCVMKVDLSYLSKGTFRANNREQLKTLVKDVREKHGWKGKIIFQELIQGINRITSHIFYLTKTCRVVWLGTNVCDCDEFDIFSMTCDWSKQEDERILVYDEFVVPIACFLNKRGYFGVVNFEIAENDKGRFLFDLNARLPLEIMHHLMAPYMASIGLGISEMHYDHSGVLPGSTSPEFLIETANQLNQTHHGRVLVLSAGCFGQEKCQYLISIFGPTKDACQTLFDKMSTSAN